MYKNSKQNKTKTIRIVSKNKSPTKLPVPSSALPTDEALFIKINHLLDCPLEEIVALLKREGLDQRFLLSFKHDRKLGSTCQVYYAYDLWDPDQRLVALKFIRTDFIDSFVSKEDYLTLKKTKNCFYQPKTVIYNRRLAKDENFVPIEQYIGELGRLCPELPISRAIEDGAKRLMTIDAYLIAFEFIPGRSVWENLVRTDFIFLDEYQARHFVRLFIENLLLLLKYRIIHCDLNGCQNYYYRPYDEIPSDRYHYNQWSSQDDDYSSTSDDSDYSSQIVSSSPLIFIDFGWSMCTADPDNDRHEILLQTIQNLFERTPRIVQLFAGRYYWDFRRLVERRQVGLRELLEHPWITTGDDVNIRNSLGTSW